jgi:hypothetical protein
MGADLERDLLALADRVAWPATPDLAGAVEQRISRSGPVAGAERRRFRPRRRALAAVLAALVLLPAGVAFGDEVLEWLGLRSVEVERVPELPDDARRPVVDELGERVSLNEAERRARFAPVVPEALGDPDEVRLDGRLVTLVYDGGDTLLAQLPGALDDALLRKVAGPGTDVRRLPDGVFFSGRDHVYLYLRPDGSVAEDRPRLAGDTFVTQRGDVLLRLEAEDLTIARARALLR